MREKTMEPSKLKALADKITSLSDIRKDSILYKIASAHILKNGYYTYTIYSNLDKKNINYFVS